MKTFELTAARAAMERRWSAVVATPARGLPASYFAEPSPVQIAQSQSSRPPKTPPFCLMPPDIRDLVMEQLGSDLGRFAAVDRASALAARRDSAWKRAYLVRAGDIDCEAELPDGLYRSCLLREAGHKQGLTPTMRTRLSQ